jgi:membrane-associated phospholipid phosphatase
MRSVRFIMVTSIIAIACILISIWFIDRPLALFINDNYGSGQLLSWATTAVETVFGFGISKYLFGFIALAIGVVLYVRQRTFTTAKLFFFVGVTHIVSRLAAGMLKNLFLRSRPFEFIGSGPGTRDFFADGGSFPSGHTAHFFGLFLPIWYLFPKQKWLMIIPVFIAMSRVLANDHYLGDVLASVYIAILATWCFANMFSVKQGELS